MLRRLRAQAARRNARIGLPDTTWVRSERNPSAAITGDLDLFAVIGTWFESDVIGATVRNAFDQGCSRVFLVDNDSPDDTVAVAEQAGAELARRFTTDVYDEALRMDLMHEVVDEQSKLASADGVHPIWWLWMDADEFHEGPAGLTIRQYLSTLDVRFRVVGARCFDHYPSSQPAYIAGHHPLRFQPLCHEFSYPMCSRGHRKHPLLRWDPKGPAIRCGNGFHLASADSQLIEPAEPIVLHHFPYRSEQFTRQRLDALCKPGGRASGENDEAFDHMKIRYETHDDVYAQKWHRVRNFAPGERKRGVKLSSWSSTRGSCDSIV